MLENEGAEVVVPDLIDFFLYCCYNSIYKYDELSGSKSGKVAGIAGIKVLEMYRKNMKKALDKLSLIHI